MGQILLCLRRVSGSEIAVAKNGALHTVCGRYFEGDGCAACQLAKEGCDRQGFVPLGQNAPPLTNPPRTRRSQAVSGLGLGGGNEVTDASAPTEG